MVQVDLFGNKLPEAEPESVAAVAPVEPSPKTAKKRPRPNKTDNEAASAKKKPRSRKKRYRNNRRNQSRMNRRRRNRRRRNRILIATWPPRSSLP